MSASNPLRLPVFGETLLQGTVLTIVMLLSLIAVSMLTCKFIELPGPGVGAPPAPDTFSPESPLHQSSSPQISRRGTFNQ